MPCHDERLAVYFLCCTHTLHQQYYKTLRYTQRIPSQSFYVLAKDLFPTVGETAELALASLQLHINVTQASKLVLNPAASSSIPGLQQEV
jgi:hypothetical protein